MVQYPNWVLGIALAMITAGVLPMPIVFCLRRFQILKVDLDIHQGSIRRNETTASTKVMMDDDDVSSITIIFFNLMKFYDLLVKIDMWMLYRMSNEKKKENLLAFPIFDVLSNANTH